LILGKISKFDATRCQILRLKCTKFDFCWAPPQTPLGSLQRSPDPLAVFKGPTSKGREGVEGGEGKGKGEDGEGREGICWTNVKLLPTRLPSLQSDLL